MYSFSRAIYRELESEILEDHPLQGGRTNHERVLRACEAAVYRLATDLHYFAKPTKTLFNDIRIYFPMSAQRRVYCVVDRYLPFAAEVHRHAARRTASTSRATGSSAAPPRGAGTACQRVPLPHNGYCPSHQHLAETEEVVAGGVSATPRAGSVPRACCLGSTSAGPSRTPWWPSTGGWSRPSRRPRPRTSPRACSPPSRPRWSAPGPARTRCGRSRHGTTVATNALLEGEGARTALVATEGFEDVVELGRQARADLYRLCAAHPAPLVPPERRVGADERMGPDGPLRGARRDEALKAAVDAVADDRARGGRRLPAARLPPPGARAGARARRSPSGSRTSTSRSPTRPSGRSASTSAPRPPRSTPPSPPCSAPTCGGSSSARARPGCPEPAVMQSSGGLAERRPRGRPRRAHRPLRARRAARPARRGRRSAAGEPDALCFDMGGTSCDVCVILDGSVREAAGREVGGRPVALPMLDIHTVGAGGGSIGWRDPGGALRVGPRSAGARPGPACYGRGGTEPTVTDANLVLGLLARRRARWAARSSSTRDAAETAVGELGDSLGLDTARVRRGHRPRRQRRDGPRAARDDRRARRRPARAGAAVLRRRGRRCTPPTSPRSSG